MEGRPDRKPDVRRCQSPSPVAKLAATRRCTRSRPRQFCDGRLCPSVTAALADLADLADGHGMKT